MALWRSKSSGDNGQQDAGSVGKHRLENDPHRLRVRLLRENPNMTMRQLNAALREYRQRGEA